MILLSIILILALLFILLLFTVTSKLIFNMDSTSSDMRLTILWLYPFAKAEIVREGNDFALKAYLLGKRILTRPLKRKPPEPGKTNVLQAVKPRDIHVDTQFGFRDPYFTGLACSAINMVGNFFKVDSLEQKPDFLALDDYIHVEATARLNLGQSLVKLI